MNGQIADMVGGVVETVGEEPEPESEGILDQHDEEEELTKVSSFNWNSPEPLVLVSAAIPES